MDRVFKSRVGWWFHMLIWLMIFACIAVVLHQNIWHIVLVLGSTIAILHVFFNTYYTVTADGILKVNCGFFPQKKIPIAEIEALEPTVFPAFSYALSLNRISIWRNGMMWMMISPQNQTEFIRLLKKFNPTIELRENTTLL